MGTISEKLTYLNTTKQNIKQAINNLGGDIDNNTTFRNYATELNDIYSNLPKVSDTGTNVSLSPALKGRLGIVPKGNTYQESTTGKNLFNKYGEFNYGNGNISTMLNSNEQIVSTSNFYVSRSKGQLISGLVANTNYCLSGTIISASGTNSNNVVIQILNTSNQQVKVQTYSSSVTKPYNFQFSFDTGENTSIWISFNGFNNSAEGTTETIFDNVQLEQGSTATSYEPYTGGQPSPSTDYPQEIQSATGTQKVVVSGKNLWNEQWENGYYNRTTGAKGSGSNYIRCADYIPITPDTTIYFNKPSDFSNYAIIFYDSSYNKLGAPAKTFTTSQPFTSPSDASYFTFYGDTGVSGATYQDNIIITKGNTATEYQPYQEPQEVDIELSSRNLFDKDNTVVGWIRSNNGTINPESGSHTSNFIKIKPNTNYIRTTREGNAFYDENKEFISYTYGNNYETPNNAKYIRITVTDVNINQEQLEEGTQATDYTPYYNYSLNRIDDTYYDKIGGTPDNWVLYKNIGKVNIVVNNTITAYGGRHWIGFNKPVDSIMYGAGNFNRYKLYMEKAYYSNAYAIYSYQTGLAAYAMGVMCNENDDATTLKNKLDGSLMYYPLAETQQTPITDTNLISQLNELYYLQSYNDTTNIDVTGNLPMRITASAIKGA